MNSTARSARPRLRLDWPAAGSPGVFPREGQTKPVLEGRIMTESKSLRLSRIAFVLLLALFLFAVLTPGRALAGDFDVPRELEILAEAPVALRSTGTGGDGAGYYLCGSMTRWAVDPGYVMASAGTEIEEYIITGLTIKASDRFVIVYFDGNAVTSCYPNVTGEEYYVDQDGVFDVSFRPGSSEITVKENTAPMEPPTEDPTQAALNTMTIYAVDNAGWNTDAMNIYWWGSNNGPGWPGVAMTPVLGQRFTNMIFQRMSTELI
jgi:hypothetical protein